MNQGDLGVMTTAEDVLTRQEQLLAMAHELDAVCPEAAAETRLFVRGGTPEQQAAGFVAAIDAHVRRLMPLWYVVERVSRGKSNAEDVAKAVEEYRARGSSGLPDVHADCFRPVRHSELAYFAQLRPGERHTGYTMLDRMSPENLALHTDRTDLRHLLVSLEEAAERVRTAIELRTEGDKLDASAWRVVPAGEVGRIGVRTTDGTDRDR